MLNRRFHKAQGKNNFNMSQNNFVSKLSHAGDTDWVFRFNYRLKISTLYHKLTNETYPVYDGKMLFWGFNLDLKGWLQEEWEKATQGIDIPNVYLNRPTQMLHNRQFTWLDNFSCPICLMQKSSYENHHCVERSDNGPDGYKNVLRICATCHAIITRGCFEERWPREKAGLFHQIMYFGLDIYPRIFYKPPIEFDKDGYLTATNFEDILRKIDQQEISERHKTEVFIKEWGKYQYQFFRDICLGKWSWKKSIKLFPELQSEFQSEFEWIQL